MAKSKRFVFTMARLTRLEPPATGRVYYHDEACPGLSLCVMASGTRTWYVYNWHDGRPCQVPIAKFPAVNVEAARKLAKDLLAKQAAGVDIRAARKARREEPTFADLWQRWEAYAKPRKRSWKEDQRQYNAFLKPLAGRRLSSIRRADIQALHDRIARDNGGYAANRALALTRAMFNRADDIGYRGDNPAVGVERCPEVARDRFLQADELKAFFTSLAQELEDWQHFFCIALLTGARRANVQAARWADMDLDRGLWLIPAAKAKAGKPLVVPLSPPAVDILRARYEQFGAQQWVFPSHGRTGHLVEPKTAWKRIIQRAELSDVRPHDLRRSLGSWMAIGGASLPIVGKALGHTQASTTQVYARLSVDPVKAAVTAAGEAMLEAGGMKLLESAPAGNRVNVIDVDVQPVDDDEPTEF